MTEPFTLGESRILPMAQTASGGMSRVMVVRVGDLAFMRLLLSVERARSLPDWGRAVPRLRSLVTARTLRGQRGSAQAISVAEVAISRHEVTICFGEVAISCGEIQISVHEIPISLPEVPISTGEISISLHEMPISFLEV